MEKQSTWNETLNAWREKRENNLRDEYGWLSLTGLHWLKEGENTIGAAEINTIALSGTTVPKKIGKLILHQGEVELLVNPDVAVTIGDKPAENQSGNNAGFNKNVFQH